MPRIDSKSRPTTRPTIRNRNQNGDKNNQRTSIEQRGSKPKGEKKKPDPQPKGLHPRRSQSKTKIRPTIGNHDP